MNKNIKMKWFDVPIVCLSFLPTIGWDGQTRCILGEDIEDPCRSHRAPPLEQAILLNFLNHFLSLSNFKINLEHSANTSAGGVFYKGFPKGREILVLCFFFMRLPGGNAVSSVPRLKHNVAKRGKYLITKGEFYLTALFPFRIIRHSN